MRLILANAPRPGNLINSKIEAASNLQRGEKACFYRVCFFAHITFLSDLIIKCSHSFVYVHYVQYLIVKHTFVLTTSYNNILVIVSKFLGVVGISSLKGSTFFGKLFFVMLFFFRHSAWTNDDI